MSKRKQAGGAWTIVSAQRPLIPWDLLVGAVVHFLVDGVRTVTPGKSKAKAKKGAPAELSPIVDVTLTHDLKVGDVAHAAGEGMAMWASHALAPLLEPGADGYEWRVTFQGKETRPGGRSFNAFRVERRTHTR